MNNNSQSQKDLERARAFSKYVKHLSPAPKEETTPSKPFKGKLQKSYTPRIESKKLKDLDLEAYKTVNYCSNCLESPRLELTLSTFKQKNRVLSKEVALRNQEIKDLKLTIEQKDKTIQDLKENIYMLGAKSHSLEKDYRDQFLILKVETENKKHGLENRVKELENIISSSATPDIRSLCSDLQFSFQQLEDQYILGIKKYNDSRKEVRDMIDENKTFTQSLSTSLLRLESLLIAYTESSDELCNFQLPLFRNNKERFDYISKVVQRITKRIYEHFGKNHDNCKVQ